MDAKLGSSYRDVVTGIAGVATGIAEYVTGCRRVLLEYMHDGSRKEEWVDEVMLTLVQANVFRVDSYLAKESPAGPASTPSSRDPR